MKGVTYDEEVALVGALAMFCLVVASAKSYGSTLSVRPAQVKCRQLAAGAYTVKVEGNSAVFTNANTGKSVTVPAKIQN